MVYADDKFRAVCFAGKCSKRAAGKELVVNNSLVRYWHKKQENELSRGNKITRAFRGRKSRNVP